MEPDEARRLVARYLSGGPVSRSDVRAALEVARADAGYLEHLAAELGPGQDWVSECDVFADCAAEFADLAPSDRGREMPQLVEHLRRCEACRHLYWKVAGTWRPAESAAPSTVRRLAKVLTEAINVVAWPGGTRVEQPAGPPVRRLRPLAAAAGPGRTLLLWSLADAEAGCTIRLTARFEEAGRVGLLVEFQSVEESGLRPLEGRVELREAQAAAPALTDSLQAVVDEPVFIREGDWSLTVAVPGRDCEYTWTVPIRLEFPASG